MTPRKILERGKHLSDQKCSPRSGGVKVNSFHSTRLMDGTFQRKTVRKKFGGSREMGPLMRKIVGEKKEQKFHERLEFVVDDR